MTQSHSNRKRNILLLATAIVCTTLISEWPDFHPEKILGFKYHWQVDMLFHSSYYLFLTLFLCTLIFNKTNVLLFALALLSFSIVLELMQAFIPKRSVDLMDVGSNALGIFVGLNLCYFYLRFSKKHKH